MSNLSDNIRIAIAALFANKLRAALTTLGIGIGIGAVIILVSLGDAAQGYITRQFLGTGADVITISGGSGGFGPRSDSAGVKLGMSDLTVLQDANNVSNVALAVAVLNVQTTTTFGANSSSTQVTGTESTYFDLKNRSVDAGRLFDQNDEDTQSRVAVLGQTTVATLFTNGENPIGRTITVNGVSFKVVGTLTAVGSSGAGQNQDDVIVVPLATAQHYLSSGRNVNGDLPVSTVYLKISDSNQISAVSTTVTALLRKTHKLKTNDDNDFTVSNEQATLNSLSSTISTLTALLAVIGGISLLVGGIGVMNIMLVTVTERTREIGLRKAVGAKFRDILTQFLTESVVLCFVGGAAGMLLAFVAVAVIGTLVKSLEPSVSISSVVLAVGVVTLIGVFFGLYPASRAAALSPIRALRSE